MRSDEGLLAICDLVDRDVTFQESDEVEGHPLDGLRHSENFVLRL